MPFPLCDLFASSPIPFVFRQVNLNPRSRSLSRIPVSWEQSNEVDPVPPVS